MNHSWKFAEFWPNRKVTTFERAIAAPESGSDLDRARAVMRQLGIEGEIDWTGSRPAPAAFVFRVTRPGRMYQVTVPDPGARAAVEQTELNAWGVMHVLHTFTGARAGDTRNDRDWALTTIWVLAMDAVSVGLILMVATGIHMWIGLPAKRRMGIAALLPGAAICGYFIFGL